MAMNALGFEQANQISQDVELLLDSIDTGHKSPTVLSPQAKTEFPDSKANAAASHKRSASM